MLVFEPLSNICVIKGVVGKTIYFSSKSDSRECYPSVLQDLDATSGLPQILLLNYSFEQAGRKQASMHAHDEKVMMR